MLLLFSVGFYLLLGCAVNLEQMTVEERVAYLEQQEQQAYDRQVARDIKEDDIRDTLIGCTGTDTIYIDQRNITASGLSRMNRRKNVKAGYPYIPRSMHPSDIGCLSPYELQVLLRQIASGY